MMAMANHELDALIAERVMHWDESFGRFVRNFSFRPSEDIADAVLVLSKLHDMYKMLFPRQVHEPGYVNIHLAYRPGRACCGAMGDWGWDGMGWMDDDDVACADTLPRAICLAALNALEALERREET